MLRAISLLGLCLAGCDRPSPLLMPRAVEGTPDTGGAHWDTAEVIDDPGEDTAAGEPGDTGAAPAAPLGACEPPAFLPVDPLLPVGATYIVREYDMVHQTALALSADKRYVFAAGLHGLIVWDVSHTTPVVVGELGALGPTIDAALAGDRVLLSHYESGLHVVDASELASLRSIASQVGGLEGVSGLAVDGEVAYVVTDGGGFAALHLGVSGDDVSVIAAIEGLDHPRGLAVAGGFAYVAAGEGLVVVDVTDPSRPAVVDGAATGGHVQDLDVEGGFLYAAVGAEGVETFALDGQGLQRVSATSVGGAAVGLDAADGLLWVTDQARAHALSLTRPSHPAPLASEPTPEWAMDAVAAGPRAWIADWSGLIAMRMAAAARAPQADVDQSTLYFTGGDALAEVILSNRGAAPLVITGAALEDPRFTFTLEALEITPGASAAIALTFEDDGAPVDSALCVATNDPDAPLVEVALAGASEGAALSVGDEAPDFALPDLDGRWRRLSERRGRPVLLTFFASW